MARKYILTPEIQKYIAVNYTVMTDKTMGKHLDIPEETIRYWRRKLKLKKKSVAHAPVEPSMDVIKALDGQSEHVRRMSAKERRQYYLEQLRSRPRYKMVQTILDADELAFYEDKYIEYFSNPDIETLTVTEEDDIHELTMTQIEKLRLQRSVLRDQSNADLLAQHSRAIKDKDETILKIKKSLSLERSQRLERQADTSTNFTNLIRELNNRGIRVLAGAEVAMFKFRMEESINRLVEDGHMRGFEQFNLGDNFKSGDLPEDYEPPPEVEDFHRVSDDGDEQKDDKEKSQEEKEDN
jgi:hypothetical protein